MRVATPVQGLGRTVTRDTTLSGCPLHEGDRVFLLWALAKGGAGGASEFHVSRMMSHFPPLFL